MISVCFQGKPFNITIIQVYVPTSNAEEAEVERFYEDLQDLLELTPQKDVLFIIGPPRHAHGDLTSLAPHERLPEILVVPREKTPTGAAARGNP